MGYPMTWKRLLYRNYLCGNYTEVCDSTGVAIYSLDKAAEQRIKMISGDLRRLEADSIDNGHRMTEIATQAGVDSSVVKKVLTVFFEGAPSRPPHDDFKISSSSSPNEILKKSTG